MKLTKLQRYSAYCAMLVEATTEEHFSGFCLMIKDMLGDADKDVMNDSTYLWYNKNVFPELKKLGSRDGMYCFNSWTDRINALKRAIKETHPDL